MLRNIIIFSLSCSAVQRNKIFITERLVSKKNYQWIERGQLPLLPMPCPKMRHRQIRSYTWWYFCFRFCQRRIYSIPSFVLITWMSRLRFFTQVRIWKLEHIFTACAEFRVSYINGVGGGVDVKTIYVH